MEIPEVLELHKQKIERLINFQDQMAQITYQEYEEIKPQLLSLEALNSKWTLRQLLKSINASIRYRPKFNRLYMNFLLDIGDKIKQNFTSEELLCNIFTNNYICMKLYENGFISIESIIKEAHESEVVFVYFAPEIKEYDPQFYDQILTENENLVNPLLDISTETHINMRENGINEDEIAISIRNNKLDEFKTLLDNTNFHINSYIPYSIYECCEFVNNIKDMPTFIEFAAYFGSYDIFKFLWESKDIIIPEKLQEYVAASGNKEILQLLENGKIDINEKAMNASILFHRDDITYYLNEKLGIRYNLNNLFESIRAFNIEIFVKILPTLSSDINEKSKLEVFYHFYKYNICFKNNNNFKYKNNFIC